MNDRVKSLSRNMATSSNSRQVFDTSLRGNGSLINCKIDPNRLPPINQRYRGKLGQVTG